MNQIIVKFLNTVRVSLKFNRANDYKNISYLTSKLSIFSISFCISILIVAKGIINGFENELKNRILSLIPHIEITYNKVPYFNWREDEKNIREVNGVIEVIPYVNFVGLIKNMNRFEIVQINGFKLDSKKFIKSLLRFISIKSLQKIEKEHNVIILGAGIAKSLNISIGDEISIFVFNNEKNIISFNYHKMNVNVVGFFKSNCFLDYKIAILSFKEAQNYLSYNGGITGFQIKTNKVFETNKIVDLIKKIKKNRFLIKSWTKNYGFIYKDIQMVRKFVQIIVILVIFLSIFSIVSTLLISIKNKSKEIAVLITIGAETSFIRNMFILYGFRISMISCFIGIIFGILLSKNLTNIVMYIEKIFHYSIISKQIYLIDFLPIKIYLKDLCVISFLTIFFSLISSIYPVQIASKIDPTKFLS
ncbi:hypothetical protein AOQ88_00575 [Candidatus Riesia sp. GBBU]|nr:hypothetical protein AOQ88_00575 [Candidatus Riesia sp. GBBU]